MTDGHLRLLRRIARQARRRLESARAADRPAAAAQTRLSDLERAHEVAEVRLSAAQARRRRGPAAAAPAPDEAPLRGPGGPGGRHERSTAELKALADYATQRLALYRRRIYLGRGEPRRLAELERIAKGASDRLTRARSRSPDG